MSGLKQDLQFALRTFNKNRGFTLAAVLTLTLGIGVNSAMFSIIRAVLLKPLAYRDPDRVVRISGGATIAHDEELKAGARSYSDIGEYFCCNAQISLSGTSGAESLALASVSANFLQILGVEPLAGRTFHADEDQAAAPKVAMISESLWRRSFSSDPAISGKSATLGATPYTIIGVLPQGFDFPFSGIDVWITHPVNFVNTASPLLRVFGRLKPGVSFAQAGAELGVLNQRYRAAHPDMLDAKPSTVPARVVPLKEDLVSNVRSLLWMLGGAVGLVLLIACANVAGLMLARAASRSREFALRAALGAARPRLIRQLLVESVLLAIAGGALGVLLARAALKWVTSAPGFDLPRSGQIHLDSIVLGCTAAASVAVGVVFGLIPSFAASRPDLAAVLRASGEGASSGARRNPVPGISARGILVITQVAISIILLTGAALLIESVLRLRNVDPGFNATNLLTMKIALSPARYDTDSKKTAFYNDLVQRVEALPGVRGAAFAFTTPLATFALTPIEPWDSEAVPLNQRLIAMFQNITPDYFRTLGIGLRRGREFTARDDAGAPLTVILNEALARKLWPAYPAGPDPVGQSVRIGVKDAPVEVVGIVADSHQFLETQWTPAMYRPLAQIVNAQAFLVRTQGDPLRFANAVRAQVAAIDRDQAVSDVHSMQNLEDTELSQPRLILALLGSFSGVALLLALTGLYGIIAYSVAQRTREFGVRRALGAQYTDILKLVFGHGLGVMLAGIVLGLGGAMALMRFLTSLLFNTSPENPATLAGVAVAFLVVGLTAAYFPARRAARIDPMSALR